MQLPTDVSRSRLTVPGAPRLALVLLACACADSSGPQGGPAHVQLVPVFASSAAPLVDVTSLAISLHRLDGTVAASAELELDLEEREVALDLEVEIAAEQETLFLDLMLLGLEDVPLFRNDPHPQRITAEAGEVVEVETTLHYVGPGADVVDLAIVPPKLAVLIGETVTLTAVATDEDGLTVADVPIHWEMLDSLLSFQAPTESGTATLLAGALPGVARITVRDPLGHRDTATVIVLGDIIPTSLEIIGDGLFGLPGTGRVRSVPAGIDCVITDGTAADDGCSAALPRDTWIALDGTASAGSTFRGWESSVIRCVGAGECRLDVGTDPPAVVIAKFDVLAPGAPILSAARFELLGLNLCQSPLGTGSLMAFRVDYNDPDRDVIIGLASLELGWQFLFEDGQGIGNGVDVGAIPGGWSLDVGDLGLGTLLTAPLCFTFEDTTQLDITMVLTDASGNVSNSVVVSVPRPDGAN